jgi:F0F1-type ATP synthase epsilon subunit
MENKIKVTIRARSGLLFQGMVDAVSSVNKVGVFDVLPWHTNFVTEIKDTIIVYLPQGLKTDFPINRGLMKVENNTVEIYVGI